METSIGSVVCVLSLSHMSLTSTGTADIHSSVYLVYMSSEITPLRITHLKPRSIKSSLFIYFLIRFRILPFSCSASQQQQEQKDNKEQIREEEPASISLYLTHKANSSWPISRILYVAKGGESTAK